MDTFLAKIFKIILKTRRTVNNLVYECTRTRVIVITTYAYKTRQSSSLFSLTLMKNKIPTHLLGKVTTKRF